MPQLLALHNVTHDNHGRNIGFFGYSPGHALVPVDLAGPISSDPIMAAEHAFSEFNVDFPGEMGKRYRERRNRSLSVGDVVCYMDGTRVVWLACAGAGWTEIPQPTFLVYASCHGTTALDPRAIGERIPTINPPLPTRTGE